MAGTPHKDAFLKISILNVSKFDCVTGITEMKALFSIAALIIRIILNHFFDALHIWINLMRINNSAVVITIKI